MAEQNRQNAEWITPDPRNSKEVKETIDKINGVGVKMG